MSYGEGQSHGQAQALEKMRAPLQKPQGEIGEEVTRLDNCLATISKQIDALLERATPVVRPSGPEKAGGQTAESVPNTALGGNIRQLTYRAQSIRDSLGGLLDRLEI